MKSFIYLTIVDCSREKTSAFEFFSRSVASILVAVDMQPILTISAEHGVDNHASQEAITAICTTENNNFLITGDTSGNMKLHDIS